MGETLVVDVGQGGRVCLHSEYEIVLRGGMSERPPAGMEAPPPQLSAADAQVVGGAPDRVAVDG